MEEHLQKRLISGTFIQLDHWSDMEGARFQNDMRRMTPDDWHLMVRDMHSIGIDTLIFQQCVDCRESWEKARSYYFHSSRPRPDWLKNDNMGAVVDAACELNMKVIFGIGTMYTRDPYLETDAVLDQALTTARELYQLYGGRSCFGGWYWTYEYPPGCASGRDSLRKIVPAVREVADCDFMIAPNIDRMMTPVLLEDIDVDIVAYQDGGGMAIQPDPLGRHIWGSRESVLHRQPELFKMLRMFHDGWQDRNGSGHNFWNCYFRDRGRTAIWNDLEIWEFDHNKALLPTEISRVVAQLELSAPFVDKQIIYQYPGLMQNPAHPVKLGGERAATLFCEYKLYREALLSGEYLCEPDFISSFNRSKYR